MTDALTLWAESYGWLCRQRRMAPANADVWSLRWRWERCSEEQRLYQQVTSGKYRLSPMQVCGRGEDAKAVWSAADALVLKWVALQVERLLLRPDACHHLRGKGVRYSLWEVSAALSRGQYAFVHRTDIRGYYEHIRKEPLVSLIIHRVSDPVLRELMTQYAYYSVENSGEIHTPTAGIPRGCALSPLIGAALLHHIDGDFASLNGEDTFYARYMDDFVVLTRTRWQLRRHIARLAEYFGSGGGIGRHPDKTQIGRIQNGFDWLGVWFAENGPAIAPRTLNNHRERRARLYEQARRRRQSHEAASERVRAYDARWNRWADGLLQVCSGYEAR